MGKIAYDGRDTYTLSTGREFYANNGIVGLTGKISRSPICGPCGFAEGYDGSELADDWTLTERQELADYMIALWAQWPTRQRA